MGLHSYVGVEGVTVTAKTPDEIFQALDYVHTLSLEVHEAQSTELTEEIVDILSKALEQMDSLYEEHSLEFPLQVTVSVIEPVLKLTVLPDEMV